jgi:uncharacterized protein YndB with AHSA1/START domain
VDASPAPQSETSVVEREVRIEAQPETVFPFFTDPEKMVRWMGVGATLDPRPGGVFSLNVMADIFLEGEFLEVVPNTRVVFTWGYPDFPGAANPIPRGSSTVEVALVPDGEATIVRLTHRLPAAQHDFHLFGWGNYLSRLAFVVAGKDPGPDPMPELIASGRLDPTRSGRK